MATAQFLSCYTHSQSNQMKSMSALKSNSPFAHVSKDLPSVVKTHGYVLGLRPYRDYSAVKLLVLRAANMAAGQPDESRSFGLDDIVNKARQKWDSSPEPVKIFPWNSVFDNFVQLVLDVVLTVLKFLYVPMLVVTSASEFTYCGHEGKSYIVPFPFLIGVSIAGVLNSVALDSSPTLKNAGVPWHLIAITVFFTLLKLPGPYYPYWGRILIPHLANGVLYRTVWLLFLWYRRPRKPLVEAMPESVPSEQDTL